MSKTPRTDDNDDVARHLAEVYRLKQELTAAKEKIAKLERGRAAWKYQAGLYLNDRDVWKHRFEAAEAQIKALREDAVLQLIKQWGEDFYRHWENLRSQASTKSSAVRE